MNYRYLAAVLGSCYSAMFLSSCMGLPNRTVTNQVVWANEIMPRTQVWVTPPPPQINAYRNSQNNPIGQAHPTQTYASQVQGYSNQAYINQPRAYTGQVYPNQTYPTQAYPVSSYPNQSYSNQNRPIANPNPILPTSSSPSHYGFEDWKGRFLAKMSASYGQALTHRLLGGAKLNNQVIRLDGNQAEFAKMPWEYLDGAVSPARVSQGRQKREQARHILSRAESLYGVPASIVSAIWGLESSYGEVMGKTDLVDALSSLAYDGRRREFAENQLEALIKLVQRGDVNPNELQGSWAGGMGHTQFIPSTWLNKGIDGDGNGRRSPFVLADALISTANYLSSAGWVSGLPVYIEVRLPSGFDYRHIGTKQSLNAWHSLGVVGVNESVLGQDLATLWLPAGINGPKLLITKNFDVIKVYNNSSNYALAIAMLANQINGKAGLVASFPRLERPLSRHQVVQLQQSLTAKGYDTKGSDGVIGTNTRSAFARWQADNGKIPDGFISQSSAMGLVY